MTVADWVVLALRVAGVALVGIAALHIWLPRLLGWSTELEGLTPMTRLVVHVHSAFIGLVCGGLGLVALLLAGELVGGAPLAIAVNGFAAVFFGIRWALEIGPIGRLADGGWRWPHRLGLVGWPVLAGTFVTAGILGMSA